MKTISTILSSTASIILDIFTACSRWKVAKEQGTRQLQFKKMWLLDTKSYTLCNFVGNKLPQYAILSHVWGEQEVSFQQVSEAQEFNEIGPSDLKKDGEEAAISNQSNESNSNSNNDDSAHVLLREVASYRKKSLASMKGWNKVTRFCDQARSKGLAYAWVDTCCIDKSSSAELQDAINSMFTWYKGSVVCFVYMSDVTISDSTIPMLVQFQASKWFTRAWTLQELLAPQKSTIEFMDSNWDRIGSDLQLVSQISAATRIPRDQICPETSKHSQLYKYSIIARLSWTSKREATRVEDRVYSLLGLFGVNMPLLYGEGRLAASHRLQAEIINTSIDETLFLWGTQEVSLASRNLATDSKRTGTGFPAPFSRGPYRMTNFGLEINSIIIKIDAADLPLKMRSGAGSYLDEPIYASPLNCHTIYDPDGITQLTLFICLLKLSASRYYRIGWMKAPYNWSQSGLESKLQPVHIKMLIQ